MISGHFIIQAVADANKASGGRFGPANLTVLAQDVQVLAGTPKPLSKSAMSARVRRLIDSGWLGGIQTGTRGTMTISLCPTKMGYGLLDIMRGKNESLEEDRAAGG
jgi:hypothetical protein